MWLPDKICMWWRNSGIVALEVTGQWSRKQLSCFFQNNLFLDKVENTDDDYLEKPKLAALFQLGIVAKAWQKKQNLIWNGHHIIIQYEFV